MTGAPASRRYDGRVIRYDGGADTPRAIDIAVESAVNIVYGDTPYAVMMTTPADLEDFAIGFSLTEGVAASMADIRGVEIQERNEGFVVAVALTPDALRRHMARRRNLSGRTSCGLCGVEDFTQVPAAATRVQAAGIAPQAIAKALAALEHGQHLFRATRAAHGAAWCDMEGGVTLVREDVGRHNALDKMIGACLRAGVSPHEGFAVVTSRCSFEMIEKTAMFGAPALVSVSAPTSLALERARALGVAIYAVARPDSAIAFLPD